ncbi:MULTISPECIES: VOC family protein [Acidobacteriaceae]|uniref:VOC family protein n=1 Tax=Acidobacteriaceae TaxID=204434 RepID=UPI00131B1B40|nr:MULTISPECIES: VOC family protein [Acidobacteriaceae]MDW5265954.1 VOC family protein [Edaphobacter sp.]
MIIDHIGIVVPSIDDGIQQWQEIFGYHRVSEVIENSRQKVRVVFLKKTDSILIKLVEPSVADSPVSSFARRGGGLHHLCFRCNDLDAAIPLLRSNGAKFIVPPQPGEAFNGEDIAFFLTRNNLSIELIDTMEKQGIDSMDTQGSVPKGLF